MIEKHSWKPVTNTNGSNAKPSPRWGHSSCVIGDELVLFGGYADSIYMNDIWIYHTINMQWTQIKTFGTVPSQRSNSSFHYDAINNQIVMFGGGGANKTRFNSVYFLNWTSKIWTQMTLKQNQPHPWERTYHSSELLYPYLIVYGGQGVADLDDLWVFNLETKKWAEIPIAKDSSRPCGRRFHSSCLIGNTFYVIAGCYSKYRPLSDVYSIDLTSLIKTGSFDNLTWVQAQIKGSSFLMRWGHACASLENKIYIFGGRFSNDLNDVLVLDIDEMKMKVLKTPPDTMPKARRRACINFIGNCMLMFGGFNSQYFNDLHYINVTDAIQKPKKYSRNNTLLIKMVNNKQNSDASVRSICGQLVFYHKGLVHHNFQSQQKLQEFINSIDGKQSKQDLINILEILYRGYGKNQTLSKYINMFPSSQEQKQTKFLQTIQKIQQARSNSTSPSYTNSLSSTNIFSSSNNRNSLLRIINGNVIELCDQQFGQFLQKNRENTYQDVTIIVNEQYEIRSNMLWLSTSSSFFKNIFNYKFRDITQKDSMKQVKIFIPHGNIVLIQIILNFILNAMLVVPQKMSHKSWQELYELADYFCAKQLCSIISYSMYSKIQESTTDQILRFSTSNKLQNIALACARFKIKSMYSSIDNLMQLECFDDKNNNKYLGTAYLQNRFQIKQKIMQKEQTRIMKKKSSCVSTEGQKQNYQVCNQ